ncbi:neurexin-4-like isoform X1 [Artemia franciscana]|uniref:Neurexin-4 n=1 Tax=Artemia franciscana TaxID=6661 RepID=A0AA88LCB6_ARTSF|nr:hypothetical protein QYM36_004733 [Artemia franciscana]
MFSCYLKPPFAVELLLLFSALCGCQVTLHNCNEPLVHNARFSATSSLPGREPEQAKTETGAWSAKNSDINQHLVIELSSIMQIVGISTRGRKAPSEFVREYALSYGSSGLDFSDYKDMHGGPKIFRGNRDGDRPHRNNFDTPIVAQYVRIRPLRWQDRISMRVELYGCPYQNDTLYFNGRAYVERNLTETPIASRKDSIRFRFKTNRADGIILYSQGSQSDYLALQLVNNKLVLNIDLGSGVPTTLQVGSLLDDSLWHDVEIDHNRHTILFSVDRVIVKQKLIGDFSRLDLNEKFYIGGVPNVREGMIVSENFTGCMENLYFNHTNVIRAVKDPFNSIFHQFKRISTLYSCPRDPTVPVTFTTANSYARLTGYEAIEAMTVSLDFRTFEENGLLVYHRFMSPGYFKLYLERGKLKVQIVAEQSPKIILDNFAQVFNDGLWHAVTLQIGRNSVKLTVDGTTAKTTRFLLVRSGGIYFIGGGHSSSIGFVGCLRSINVDGNFKSPLNWKDNEYTKDDIIFDTCHMIDRCDPNPCEHGGICRQSSSSFTCNCTNSGYTGAVCHTAAYPLSCQNYRQNGASNGRSEYFIDIDGSGILPAFPVTCEILNDGRTLTHVGHNSEVSTSINGFDLPGSFIQDIQYDASFEQMELLINRSYTCSQRLRYDCRKARLLNSPYLGNQEFKPFSWWVSKSNQKMDYWAGALPGSRKCECGLFGTCVDPNKWCNCDSAFDTWLTDEGQILEKDYLPIRQIRAGDTGNTLDGKEAKFSVGSLVCEGDILFDQVVTFRVSDSSIDFPTFDMGFSADIYFEFKTTQLNAVLLHSVGPSDYIKLSIINGDKIQFQYQVGGGPMAVTVDTSNKLSDNNWHSIMIERNRKEAKLTVDALKSTVTEPLGPARPIILTSHFVLGSTVDYRDGFVGCMRGLTLNGRVMDLKSAADRGLYGIGHGCTGKCDSSPCLNNGTCTEGYDRYTCDCRFTSFKGPICADEIGVNLQSNYMIKYTFPGTYKSTMSEFIRVGFTTTDPKGFLLGLYSDISKEYLTLRISNSGHLSFVFDFGFERRELIFEDRNFATGQFHDVKIRRVEGGTKILMTVDDYEPRAFTFPINPSADAQFNNIQYLYLGKNESMSEGFVGCISRVEFDDIYPLKWLFQQDRPSTISSKPDGISEDFCGIEPVTHPPEERESRPPPVVDEDRVRSFYPPAQAAILGGILAVIFIALVFMLVLIGRYMSRHKGDYITQEDKGADEADDPDDAVMRSQTGANVQKKKGLYCLCNLYKFSMYSSPFGSVPLK